MTKINITEDGLVTKEIIQEGNGEVAMKQSTVKVVYELSVNNGNPIEIIDEKEIGFRFQLGKDSVIKGLDLAVSTMRVGEIAIITIQSEYGYGERTFNKIPANQTLIYKIELLEFNDDDIKKEDFTIKERYERSQIYKNKGNELFKDQKYEEAQKVYQNAYDWVNIQKTNENKDQLKNDENLKECQKFKLVLMGNQAAVLLKLSKWQELIQICTKIIKNDPYNLKAYFRRAQANGDITIKNYQESINDLQKCQEIDPKDTLFQKEINKYQQLINKEKSREKNIMSKMFQGDIYDKN